MWRRMAARVGVSAMAIGGLVLAGASAGASAATATTSAWSNIEGVSCASVSHCWATTQGSMGSTVLATTDGGSRWAVQLKTTKTISSLDAIECASTTRCLVAGAATSGSDNDFFLTTDGGKVWTAHHAPAGLAGVDAISCVGHRDCWAVGTGPSPALTAVLARSANGGRSWSLETIPKIRTAMTATFGLSCPSERTCIVTGESTLTTTNGGRTWAEHSNPEDAALQSVDCPSIGECYAVYNVTSAVPSNESTFVYRSIDDGVTWSRVLDDPRPVVSLGDVSCPTSSTCVAVGAGYRQGVGSSEIFYGAAERTIDGGRVWSEVKVTGTQGLYADSCAAGSTDCVAGGWSGAKAAIRRSTNDGATWQRETVPALS